MSNQSIIILTRFADESLIIPLGMMLTLMFGLLGWWEAVIGWLIAVIGTQVTLVVTKIFFYVIGNKLPVSLYSPSAHVAAGGVVYGVLLSLLLRGRKLTSATAMLASGLFALVFGLTRLAIHAHSRSEVVVGALFAMMGAVTFVRLAGAMPVHFDRVRLAAAAGLVLVLFYGGHMNAEPVIRATADVIRSTLKGTFAPMQ